MNASTPHSRSTRRHGAAGRSRRPNGRAIRRGAAVGTVLAAATAAGVVLVATTSGAGAGGSCAGGRALTVDVTPDLVGPVQAAAAALPSSAGGCRRIAVTARPSAAEAAALAAGRGKRPDVWIPDSSLWAASAANRTWSPPRARPSVALTPVVLGVRRDVAAAAGPPGQDVSLTRILAGSPGSSSPGGAAGSAAGNAAVSPAVRLALADPKASATSIGALLAVQEAVRATPGSLAGVLRQAENGSPDPAAAARSLRSGSPVAVATTEQALWAANTGPEPIRAVAVYPRGGMTLDYPFLVLTGDSAAGARARALLTSLQSGPGRQKVLAAGFRTASDGLGPALGAGQGVQPARRPGVVVPSPEAVARAVHARQVVDAPSRLLAVIDVSGSMGETVPGTGGATRLTLVTDAAARGLGLYPDSADIGLWVFATDLAGSTDYRELVPLGPLAPRSDGVPGRERLVSALGQIRRMPSGGTGLYDTTLAAVRSVRRSWDPGRANSVVLLTDGRNDDRDGIGLSQLLASLRSEASSGKPVPVIPIAYGGDTDVPALQAIASATGGQLYLAQDPRNIGAVFLDAIGRRACSAGCPAPPTSTPAR